MTTEYRTHSFDNLILEERVARRPDGLLVKLSRKLIINALRQMKRGSLSLELTDGTRMFFGDGEGSVNAQIRVLDNQFFVDCLIYGHIGFAESYIKGDWQTDNLSGVIAWFILNLEGSTVLEGSAAKFGLINLFALVNKLSHWRKHNSFENSKSNIGSHYDLGNEFFAQFLDPTMTYSSAHFTVEGQSLKSAQLAKYDRLCQLLRLSPNDRLLEIGTGWGGFAIYAAKNYGCRVTTTTISQEQFKYACQLVLENGLNEKVEVINCDYRLLTGSFDKIVSIEMVEAVGDQYYETFFEKLSSLLRPEGLIALQMITCPDSRFEVLRNNVDFIQKHIFPGSLIPSIERVLSATKKTGSLFLYDLKDLGNSYALTLDHWQRNFVADSQELIRQGFDDRFIRKWFYYFSYCKAAFAMRNLTVVQAVFTKPNNLKLSTTTHLLRDPS